MKVKSNNFRILSIFIIILSFTLLYFSLALLDKSLSPEVNKFQTPETNLQIYPQFYGNDSDPNWSRENTFINNNNYLRQGYGYEIKTDNIIPKEVNPDPTRILIFGDSFLWGNGNTDPSSTLDSILYRKLNSPGSTPKYEVKLLTQPGRSTFNYYDLFTENPIQSYNPDIVIYAYHGNDYMPSFTESLICKKLSIKACQSSNARTNPQYQSCLKGDAGIIPVLISKTLANRPNLRHQLILRACEPIYLKAKKEGYDQDQYFNNPTASPYYSDWIKALSLLKQELSPYKVLVANLTSEISTQKTNEFMEEKMQAAGYDVIPMSLTYKAVYLKDELIPNSNLLVKVNPINDHPSSYLNNAYADDIINYLGININQIEETNPSDKNLSSKKLVAYTMPYFDITNQSITPNKSKLTFDSKANPTHTQSIIGNPNLPFQFANCMNLGYSNFQFTLGVNQPGKQIKISNLPKNEKHEIGFYYYDEKLARKYQKLKLNTSNLYQLPKSEIPPTLTISFPEYAVGCPLDKEITAPNFEIELELLG
jgi:hypothetical protein